ncbi:MAG: DNA repair protein RecN [Pseudomonadota bacterium]
MLYALSIHSFVLIDRLDLEAATGFTALTGETGAGKSIILDALALVLGGAANRQQIRAGADQASVSAEFGAHAAHPVWDLLAEQGLEHDRGEPIVLRRTLSKTGPSRAFVNGQSVAASVLAKLGESLVEIHGQHAASHLMRPSAHLALLDASGGLEDAATHCAGQWRDYEAKREARIELEANVSSAQDKRDWLSFAVEELARLAPEQDEVEALSAQRSILLQSERMSEAIDETVTALSGAKLDEDLAAASRASERVARIPGLETYNQELAVCAQATADAIERTLIELSEARQHADALARFTAHDADRLEHVEARLFALRAAARKFECLPELLIDSLARFQSELALCDASTEALEHAAQAEAAAHESWRAQAESLSAARQAAAKSLEQGVLKELEPLHLGRVRMRAAFVPMGVEESGLRGLERVEFEIESNPGSGFGPLKSIASGGELARISLALKCALSQGGDAGTLIFDEADQGVGGAVAAAIGERLSRLSADRQVFAITHSPQVASAATRQWRVIKEDDAKGQTVSHVAQLDDGQRLEEIARMLSGSSVTNEARAAALKLLEAA